MYARCKQCGKDVSMYIYIKGTHQTTGWTTLCDDCEELNAKG